MTSGFPSCPHVATQDESCELRLEAGGVVKLFETPAPSPVMTVRDPHELLEKLIATRNRSCLKPLEGSAGFR